MIRHLFLIVALLASTIETPQDKKVSRVGSEKGAVKDCSASKGYRQQQSDPLSADFVIENIADYLWNKSPKFHGPRPFVIKGSYATAVWGQENDKVELATLPFNDIDVFVESEIPSRKCSNSQIFSASYTRGVIPHSNIAVQVIAVCKLDAEDLIKRSDINVVNIGFRVVPCKETKESGEVAIVPEIDAWIWTSHFDSFLKTKTLEVVYEKNGLPDSIMRLLGKAQQTGMKFNLPENYQEKLHGAVVPPFSMKKFEALDETHKLEITSRFNLVPISKNKKWHMLVLKHSEVPEFPRKLKNDCCYYLYHYGLHDLYYYYCIYGYMPSNVTTLPCPTPEPSTATTSCCYYLYYGLYDLYYYYCYYGYMPSNVTTSPCPTPEPSTTTTSPSPSPEPSTATKSPGPSPEPSTGIPASSSAFQFPHVSLVHALLVIVTISVQLGEIWHGNVVVQGAARGIYVHQEGQNIYLCASRLLVLVVLLLSFDRVRGAGISEAQSLTLAVGLGFVSTVGGVLAARLFDICHLCRRGPDEKWQPFRESWPVVLYATLSLVVLAAYVVVIAMVVIPNGNWSAGQIALFVLAPFVGITLGSYVQRLWNKVQYLPSRGERPWFLLYNVLAMAVLVLLLWIVARAAIPSQEPSRRAFASTTELYSAVDEYLDDSTSETEVAKNYGWPIGEWDVSNIENFRDLFNANNYDGNSHFNHLAATFNEDISDWDVSSATSLKSMFSGAAEFHQDLFKWNTSHVRDFEGTFFEATAFNSDISDWDVSSANDMFLMFKLASTFNQDISGWDVSQVRRFRFMFQEASSFKQDLCDWGEVAGSSADFRSMFSFTNCPSRSDPVLTATPPGPFCYQCEV